MSTPDLVRSYFEAQSRACTKLGSPFMGRLMTLMAARLTDDTEVGARVLHWSGDPSPAADNPSLRLAGALHALVLTGADAGLASVYPPHDVPDDAVWTEVVRALSEHEATLLPWLDRAPQTNEVRRAAALIPVWHMIARATARPLALWEVGCSAGLNLRADLFRLAAGGGFGPRGSGVQLAPDWEGPIPLATDLAIVDRRGVDLSPLDPANPDHQLRLRAYLWPDQADRRMRTDAAIGLAQQAAAQIEVADAVDWLGTALGQRPTDACTVIYHTIAWQYLPPAARAKGEALIAEAGAQATSEAPLAHVALEADDESPGAGLSVRIWPGGAHIPLARVDYHGRWVTWTGPTELSVTGD